MLTGNELARKALITQITLLFIETTDFNSTHHPQCCTTDIGVLVFHGIVLQGVLEQITVNNMPIGRSVDETLRLVQAIQYVKQHGEVCPANWKPGSPTMVSHKLRIN